MHIKNKYSPINNQETKYFSIFVVFSKIIRFSSFFIFIVVYFLFFLSLEKCFEGEKICSKKSGWIRIKLNEALISCFLLSLLFELMVQKIISKLHLIHVIIVFILFLRNTFQKSRFCVIRLVFFTKFLWCSNEFCITIV